MEFFDVVKKRRSIRRFKPEQLPNEVIQRALEAAVLAPNSSNIQAWDFHWIQNSDLQKKVAEACLNQSAARTATQLVVVVANPSLWKRSQKRLVEWVVGVKGPKLVVDYYDRLIPLVYGWGLLNLLTPLKIAAFFLIGLFRPITRTPASQRDLEEVSIKSAALAAENFVLAVCAQGGATCMMEGFDERRLKRLLRLPFKARIVMVIGAGYEAEKGTWGTQYRLPLEEVVHIWK